MVNVTTTLESTIVINNGKSMTPAIIKLDFVVDKSVRMDIEYSNNDCKDTTDIETTRKIVKKVKRLNKIAKKGIVASLEEFAQNSTLHGLRYIVDTTLSYVEKIFWFLVVVASIITCSFLIHNVYTKLQSNPIIITMNEKLIPVDQIDYPSVTICPQIKVKKDTFDFKTEREYYRRFKWSGYNETPSQSVRLSKFANIALVCDDDLKRDLINFPIKDFNVSIENILDVALDFDDIFESCHWNTNPVSCKSLFQKVLIREGVCFTTNALDADEIIRKENQISRFFFTNEIYRQDLSEVYPIKGSASDASAEFSITLREYDNYDDKSCKRYNTGFIVYIQSPADMPQASLHSYAVKTNQIMYLKLKFDSVFASKDLKSYPIQTRQCYFPEEPYLKFFRTYTENNCRIECFTNYTKQLCGCVAFYMPRDNLTRICRAHYTYCVYVAQTLLYGYLRPEKVKEFNDMFSHSDDTTNKSLITIGKEFADACNCLPTCNTVNYDADVTKVAYDFEYYFDFYCTQLGICDNNETSYKYSKIEWIFKRPNFSGMIRSSIFGVTDFIALCGGLLGLFLGFSFLTIIEIIYYVTIRFGCIVRRENLSRNISRGENVN